MEDERIDLIYQICSDTAYWILALIQLLVDKGIFTQEEIQAEHDKIEAEEILNAN